MKVIRLLILSLCMSLTGFSAEPEDYIERFFSHLPSGEIRAAVDEIFQTSPWLENKEDQKTTFSNRLLNLTELIGDYHGYDFLAQKKIGENLLGYAYMARYDRQPIRFRLIFYKAEETWILYNISFDDNVGDDLNASLKASSSR